LWKKKKKTLNLDYVGMLFVIIQTIKPKKNWIKIKLKQNAPEIVRAEVQAREQIMGNLEKKSRTQMRQKKGCDESLTIRESGFTPLRFPLLPQS
jgi:hypothetical protein